MRTYGLCRIGRTQKEFLAHAADLLCHKTAQTWLGAVEGDHVVPLASLDHYLAEIQDLMKAQSAAEPAMQLLAEKHATAVKEAIGVRLAGQGGVLAARAVAQGALECLRGMKAEAGQRRERLESLLALSQMNNAAAATSPPPQPKSWFARRGPRKPPTSEARPSDQWNGDVTTLQSAAIMLQGLQDRVAAHESLRNLESDLRDLVENFAETADDDLATFLDVSHPELVAQFDQEWRMGILGGKGKPLAASRTRGARGRKLARAAARAGRAKVLDALRRDEFRALLPGGQGAAGLEPGLLKSAWSRAAPGWRRLAGAAVCG